MTDVKRGSIRALKHEGMAAQLMPAVRERVRVRWCNVGGWHVWSCGMWRSVPRQQLRDSLASLLAEERARNTVEAVLDHVLDALRSEDSCAAHAHIPRGAGAVDRYGLPYLRCPGPTVHLESATCE